ncbi:glycosyltransferase [Candidatus Dependentiae bacterium]|nr:glycosyltransferase [Candidatus Dependentiae bacterium]
MQKNMRVGFYFGRKIFSKAESGGAFTFAQSIFNQLCKTNINHEIFIFSDDADKFKNSNNVKFVKINRFYSNKNESFIKRLILKIPRKILRILQNKKYKSALNKSVIDNKINFMWFATPAYEYVNVPYAFTVWDLQHRLQTYFPEVSLDNEFEHREKYYNSVILKSSFVIIGNGGGKKEISKFYNYPENRIKILPLPTPDFVLRHDFKSEVKLGGEKYLFYPAQFWPHKNHVLILYAIRILKKKYNLDFKVIFTGSDKGNLDYIKSKVQELDLKNKVEFLGFVSIKKLIMFYKNAFALVFPSFFGPDNIPPLEAFTLGCPVIAARVSGSEYQLKDAALLFDPKNEFELVDCIKRLYENNNLKKELIEKGLKVAKSWTAKEYVESIFNIVDDFEKIRRCWD